MTLPTSAEGGSENHRARTVGIGAAHAKAILLGEHAVVYGAPALALPVPRLKAVARAKWAAHATEDRCGVAFTTTGSAPGPTVAASDGMRRLAVACRAAMGMPDAPYLDVIIRCAIPPGRGLGSSAACARAMVLALADLFGRAVTESTVFDLVQTAENVVHGRASGVDARTVAASAPLLFQQGEARELPIGCDGSFVIADSGETGRTKDAVELLRAALGRRSGAREAFVSRASKMTDEARHALAEGEPEELGARLTDYHELLRAAGLSTDRIETLVEAALAAGSLGAKITGGGLGGCVIALTRAEQAKVVTRQLHEAGAVQTWVVPLKEPAGHAR
ncbi:mevalonate kinase [Streptomyces sp. NPDC012510]|uniref:mevalonate kinase n=1 Tax=Streptomyces sp. NPDC012510 TaxID=3364838 RepID=UPI0036E2F158